MDDSMDDDAPVETAVKSSRRKGSSPRKVILKHFVVWIREYLCSSFPIHCPSVRHWLKMIHNILRWSQKKVLLWIVWEGDVRPRLAVQDVAVLRQGERFLVDAFPGDADKRDIESLYVCLYEYESLYKFRMSHVIFCLNCNSPIVNVYT